MGWRIPWGKGYIDEFESGEISLLGKGGRCRTGRMWGLECI